ncbi:hypothetical protein [Plesiomonas shigelloides]|uniref:hypothetical protein n=1 Tax=Plesiomonas shigelloides TaxID=703 RepID=UPI00387F200A
MKLKCRMSIVWHGICFLLAVVISLYFRKDIEFKEAQGLISILQNTSAMIFTIMGLWIAYVYPNVILQIVQPSKIVAVFSDEDELTVKLLIGIVVLSAITMGLLVIGTAVQLFIVKSRFFVLAPEFFSFLGILSLLVLTYIQVFCIYMVIVTSVNFVIKIKNMKHNERLSSKLDGEE